MAERGKNNGGIKVRKGVVLKVSSNSVKHSINYLIAIRSNGGGSMVTLVRYLTTRGTDMWEGWPL